MGGRGASSSGGGGGGSRGGGGGEDSKAASGFTRTYTSSSGGVVDTEQGRLDKANINKQERQKYDKEHNIAKKVADEGNHVEHLDDKHLPDGSYDSRINGVKADFKETKGSGNVVRYGKEAINDQKAEMVVFNFTKFDTKTATEIGKLTRMGIHGWYYKPGIATHFEF